jgi:acyl-CoA synthetase (AMP-forming)/AMP-acid ligase II
MLQAVAHPRFEPATLVGLLRMRAAERPAFRVFTFLVDGDLQETHLTCGELDRQARAIGALLQELDAPGQRALLLYAPGLEFIAGFFGCLYASVVAVPAYPPNPGRLAQTLPKFRALVNDARVSFALTTSSIRPILETFFAEDPDLRAIHWLTTNDIVPSLADRWQNPKASPDTLTLLQYTSGSTGAPRGVMLSHRNILHNQGLLLDAFEHHTADVGVGWLPLYHDMGLFGQIVQPLYAGGPVVLLSPLAFLQRPLRWLQAISRYRGTTSGGPNFAYDLCVRKITPEERATLDLTSWTLAANGAETIREATIDRFVAAFGPCGFRREAFYPCYGLAEATLIVAGGARADPPATCTVRSEPLGSNRVVEAARDEADSQTFVGCGHTLGDQHVVIVDPESLRPCPPDRVGEIWVSGPGVAQGYWNSPEATARTFRARLEGTGDGPFLRTGDLGFSRDGELFITGRLKDLIIVDGRNHYPQDIEFTVEQSHAAVRPGCCAAFSVDVDGEERVVVVAEIDAGPGDPRPVERRLGQGTEPPMPLDRAAVITAIRRAVADYHDLRIEAVSLLKKGSLPKTSSGKIERHACRAGFLARSLDVWAE